jgi:uncharacterized membrane protein YcjF (UPF0283 family)
MTTDWSFETLFAHLGWIRMGFGIVFGLFLLLFVTIVIEEVFLGGRRRRQAEKKARLDRDEAGQ